MKFSLKYLIHPVLLLTITVLSSCQEELDPAPEPANDQAITALSPLSKLISDVSAHDGSFDNIVDAASCIAIKFPYTVDVNGVEMIINSKEDFNTIEVSFDTYELDEDTLEIHFPVTVIGANFREVVVENLSQLTELAQQCIEGGDDPDIECIDFVYPITIFTFDVSSEQTDRVIVNKDEELWMFIGGLDENDRISFDYPLNLIRKEGTQLSVNNNAELAVALSSARNACDEDDDADYNDDDFTEDRLNSVLVDCPWFIKELERDDTNHSETYFLSRITFEQGGAASYTDREGTSLTGTWNTSIANNIVELSLQFDGLDDLNGTWLVFELEEGEIKLLSATENKIILQSECDGYNNEAEILSEILKECDWIVKKAKKDLDLDQFLGYNLDFSSDNMLTMTSGSTTLNGSWEVSMGAQNNAVLTIEMEGDEPSISFAWPLKELRYERLVFEDETGDYKLTLEQNCYNDEYDSEVNAARELVEDGQWRVSAFTHNSDPNFISFPDTFDFESEGVFKSTTAEIGTWRLYRNSDGELELILSFEPGSNYTYLGNDWKVVEITADRIELNHEDGTDYDHLIFQRP
ncbi:MAG: hypothetical protein AB3N14_06880 [Flavobacteriaceae bacterium]